mmetsp:Transcript_5372/g.9443  ORF Transcript_5372/g.9443 Transcript_5372/m.9443 type:complete len:584 (-) Transcript_5372:4218-5969(-)
MGGQSDIVLGSIAEYLRALQLSSRAMDYACGIVMGTGLCLVVYWNVQLFEPYLLIITIAALFSNALRPFRDFVYEIITNSDVEKSDLQVRRESQTKTYFNMTNLAFLFLAFLLLCAFQPIRALAFVSLLAVFAAVVGFSLLVLKFLVFLRVVDSRAGAAGCVMFTFALFIALFVSVFVAGITRDLVRGVTGASHFVVDAVKNDPRSQEFVAEKLDLVRTKALELAEANQEKITSILERVEELSGVPATQYAHIIVQQLEVSQNGTSVESAVCDLSSSVNGTEACVSSSTIDLKGMVPDLETVKGLAVEYGEKLRPYVPRSVEEARALVAQVRETVSQYNVEEYSAVASNAFEKIAAAFASIAAFLADAFGSIRSIGAFLVLLFFLLAHPRSAVSFLTDIIPFPRREFNEIVELDLRVALSAMFWGTVKYFMLHVVFVWLIFSALGLNFSFLAALLAGLAAALPFMPPPFVFSLVFSAAQLIAGRRWIEFAVIGTHMFVGNDRSEYLESIKQHMTVGASILNDELLTLSSVLGAAVFGKKGILIAPLLITFSLVIYQVFSLLNSQDQQNREKLLTSTDENLKMI